MLDEEEWRLLMIRTTTQRDIDDGWVSQQGLGVISMKLCQHWHDSLVTLSATLENWSRENGYWHTSFITFAHQGKTVRWTGLMYVS